MKGIQKVGGAGKRNALSIQLDYFKACNRLGTSVCYRPKLNSDGDFLTLGDSPFYRLYLNLQ